MNKLWGITVTVLLSTTFVVGPVSGAPAAELQKPVLTLDEAVARARAQNPDLAVMHAKGQAAKSRLNEAREGRYPDLSIASSLSYYADPLRLIRPPALGAPAGFGDQYATLGVQLKQPLFTGSALSNTVREKEQLAAAAGHTTDRFASMLEYRVEADYVEILGREAILGAIEATTQSLQRYRQDVQHLIEARKAARLDLLKVDVRLSALRQTRLRSANARDLARQHLLNDMGEQAGAFSWRLVAPAASPMDTLGLDQWRQCALSARGDIKAAMAAVRAREFAVAGVKANRWPRIDLQGSYNRAWILNDQEPGAPTDEQVALVGLVLSYPLPFGSGLQPRIRVGEAEVAAARAAANSLRQKVLLEVESAFLNLKSANERLQGATETETMAREALRIQQDKFSVAKATSQDVLDAEAALLATQTDYLQAQLDVQLAGAALRLAAGKEEL